MRRYEDLIAWQKAHVLVLDVYRLTRDFPREELYGLTSQIRRAAVSVSANIIEGNSRDSAADFARFINMAEGSLIELDYLLRVSRELEYGSNPTHAAQIRELGAVLHGLKARQKAER